MAPLSSRAAGPGRRDFSVALGTTAGGGEGQSAAAGRGDANHAAAAVLLPQWLLPTKASS